MAILALHDDSRTAKPAARRLTDAKRIIVKVGSSLLVDAEKGRLNRGWLESFVATWRGFASADRM